ncbi:uncharacterized protein LOC143281517 [Babylonia areolata]|uniref:uncharacterized protein LOC143281517 n=1 Tax=Babylonia areolata TaxID=304850 RepID=UPI003FD4F551
METSSEQAVAEPAHVDSHSSENEKAKTSNGEEAVDENVTSEGEDCTEKEKSVTAEEFEKDEDTTGKEDSAAAIKDSAKSVAVGKEGVGTNGTHTAVEADCSPVGSGDCVVESGIEMDLSDEEDLGDTSGLNAEERNQLFARGLSHEKGGRREVALKCYLGCLSGLSKDTRFVLLPQCLRNIAEIYYQNQEFDKAIHFIQAEKLYYENALINTEEIQKKLEELTTGQGEPTHPGSGEPDTQAMETLRAEEYEHLARLCMDKQQPELALEYAGKCTKLRQQLFGQHHPKTQESLEFFSSLYAEVGKHQYNDSMQNLSSPTTESDTVPVVTDSEGSTPSTPTGDGTPVSILRHRKNSDREKKQVRFHESVVDNSHQRVQEEWLSRTVVTIMLFICFFFLAILCLGLYCRLIDSHMCRSVVEAAHSAFLQMRYQYYKYTSTKHVKFA